MSIVTAWHDLDDATEDSPAWKNLELFLALRKLHEEAADLKSKTTGPQLTSHKVKQGVQDFAFSKALHFQCKIF